MSDPLRTDSSRAPEAAADAERDAKIEHLLIVGLDHYFAAEYDQAINVWTRALFLDRSHAKARAYIERARSALAERQRESEELLQRGVAAFQLGEADEARRLLQTALQRGAPSEEALAILDRLNRLAAGAAPHRPAPAARREVSPISPAIQRPSSGLNLWLVLWLLAVATLVGGIIVAVPSVEWRSLAGGDDAVPASTAPPATDASFPLPLRGETALARARTYAAGGHLHEALAELDDIPPTDQRRAEVDELRSRLQRELMALTPVPAPREPARGDGVRP